MNTTPLQAQIKILQSVTINWVFEPMKRNINNLKNGSYQTPMAHAETAPDHSFGQFQRQHLQHVSWMLQLYWLMQQHPAKRSTDAVNLERIKLVIPCNRTKFLTN